MERQSTKWKKGKTDPLERKRKGRPHPEQKIVKEQNWKKYLASDEEEPADADLFTDEESEREDEELGESEEK